MANGYLPKRHPWRKLWDESPVPVNARDVHPLCWQIALDLSGWDTDRFRIMGWTEVIVVNSPRYPVP